VTGGVAILVPAAGASRRMRGRDKLLEVVRGRALLRERAEVALALGADVLVTLPPGGAARAAVLDGLAVARCEVPEAAEGMAASLRAGAGWARARGACGLMVLLPDMPDLTEADIRSALQAYDDKSILRATTEGGQPGHPVIFPAALLPEMAALRGDAGARDLLSRHPVRLLPLPGTRAITDLDTPEDWAAWRARNAPDGAG
jgi:CTP:molybdopterin cytidylyltransferase MocA